MLSESDTQDVAGVLSRISVHPCFSLERDMPAILDTISTGLESAEEGRAKPSVLVVEPITDLFKNVLNNSSAQGTRDLSSQTNDIGHAMMVTLLEDLSELTHTHGLLTIVRKRDRESNASSFSIPRSPLCRPTPTLRSQRPASSQLSDQALHSLSTSPYCFKIAQKCFRWMKGSANGREAKMEGCGV